MSMENNNFFGDKPFGPGGPGGSGGPGGGGTGGGGAGGPGQPNKDSGTFSMEYRHNPVSARVPEKIARGVMSTGVLVLDGPTEFVMDFMQGLTRPMQVAARVVVSPPVMEQFVAALKDNLNKYEQRFGPPPPMPKPPTDRRPTLQEIYDEFKLSDDQLSGTYANAVMIGLSPAEFFFDFITNFYPTSAVSCRVYMAAVQIPRTLDAMNMAVQRYHQRVAAARQAQMQQPPTQWPPHMAPPQPGSHPGGPQNFQQPPKPPDGPQDQPPQGPQPPEGPKEPPAV